MFVLTFSLYSGSYFSSELGTSKLGNENNFKFPFPVTFSVACRDSEAFSSVLVLVNSTSNSPTAPLKFFGAFSGKPETLISLFPAVTVFGN